MVVLQRLMIGYCVSCASLNFVRRYTFVVDGLQYALFLRPNTFRSPNTRGRYQSHSSSISCCVARFASKARSDG